MERPLFSNDSVDLSLLEQRDDAATKAFVRQIHTRGIGVIRVSDRLHELHERCVAAARAFFSNVSKEEKMKQKMGNDGARDWGYVEAGVKEFWQMRHNTGEACPWPELSKEYFEAQSEIARVCLAALARGLKTAEENLVEKMMDPRGDKLVGPSSTIFRFFHYYEGVAASRGGVGDDRALGCLSHTDIGLITLIPATNFPALETMDNINYSWGMFEHGLGSRDMMVLCGETLERLTAFYYPAVIHRVSPIAIDRYSLVFLLRARPDAVLDCASLNSPLVVDCGDSELKRVETVAQFMKEKYLNKKSANFSEAGQGLPLKNFAGTELKKEDLDKWNENPDIY